MILCQRSICCAEDDCVGCYYVREVCCAEDDCVGCYCVREINGVLGMTVMGVTASESYMLCCG